MSTSTNASSDRKPAAGDENVVQYDFSEGVATLTLNRPDKLNSLNAAMHTALRSRLTEISGDRAVRAVLLTGTGRGFCTGQDLSERKVKPGEPPRDLGRTIEENWNPLARLLRYLDVPVVGAVNGVAAGAGMNIALACDIVLAARSAAFVPSFAKVGLVPDAGGTHYLPQRIGTARAMGVAMLGEKITAEQAENWGLIWRVIDDGKLIEEARKLAVHLARQPTKGLGMTKRAIYAAQHNSFEEQLELERRSQRICGASKDYQEGVAAFLEKRAPHFTGE